MREVADADFEDVVWGAYVGLERCGCGSLRGRRQLGIRLSLCCCPA